MMDPCRPLGPRSRSQVSPPTTTNTLFFVGCFLLMLVVVCQSQELAERNDSSSLSSSLSQGRVLRWSDAETSPRVLYRDGRDSFPRRAVTPAPSSSVRALSRFLLDEESSSSSDDETGGGVFAPVLFAMCLYAILYAVMWGVWFGGWCLCCDDDDDEPLSERDHPCFAQHFVTCVSTTILAGFLFCWGGNCNSDNPDGLFQASVTIGDVVRAGLEGAVHIFLMAVFAACFFYLFFLRFVNFERYANGYTSIR